MSEAAAGARGGDWGLTAPSSPAWHRDVRHVFRITQETHGCWFFERELVLVAPGSIAQGKMRTWLQTLRGGGPPPHTLGSPGLFLCRRDKGCLPLGLFLSPLLIGSIVKGPCTWHF